MPFLQVTIKVTNQNDMSAVSGARVFIDGSANFDPNQFTVATNSAGTATFQVPSNLQNRVMQITADGFTSTSQLVNTAALLPISLQIALVPTAPQSQLVTVQFIPRVAGIVYTLQQSPSPVLYQGVTGADGSDVSPQQVPFGLYTLVATLTGYQTLSTSVSINGQVDPYTFNLTQTADQNSQQQGNTNGNSASLTSTPANIVSQVTTEPPSQSEYIYPNSDYDKYFTTISARMYIGNLFIDELFSLNFALQDNTVPIYGYPSRYYDALGQGRSLVQGQLTINFVTEGYLYTVLQEYKKYLKATQGQGFPVTSPSVDTVAQVLGLMATRDNLTQTANSNLNGDPAASARAGQIQQQITALMAAMTPDQIQSLSTQRERQLTTFNDVVGFDNAVYQDVLFDIRVEMGNEVTGVKRIRYFEKCKLISNEQVFDQSGQVLLDSYGFVARRVR